MTPITCIEVYRVAMPLVYPFRTAFGNDDTIESILVRIEADGLSGWGEATPWRYPAYSAEAAATTFVMVRDFLAPLVLGRTIESGAGLQALLAGVKGNPFAKAALDLAWWDLSAKSRGKPLWQALGGTGPVVDVGADFGVMESIDALLATVAGAVAAGYKRVKLKYRPGWELDMVLAVRQAFPTTTIHVDCNSAYTWRDTEMFRKLDAFELAMIEQPLAHDDLIDHAELQKQLQTPICLDESITSPDKARKAIKIGACKWVNIKPGRVGGLSQAVQIHDLCRNAGIPCWVGGMLESAVGAAHCLALATLANMKYPADIFPSARFYKRDLSTPEIVHSGPSQVTASPRPGVGTAPDPELLARCRIESALLRR